MWIMESAFRVSGLGVLIAVIVRTVSSITIVIATISVSVSITTISAATLIVDTVIVTVICSMSWYLRNTIWYCKVLALPPGHAATKSKAPISKRSSQKCLWT